MGRNTTITNKRHDIGNNKMNKLSAGLFVGVFGLAGCATPPCCNQPAVAIPAPQAVRMVAPAPGSPTSPDVSSQTVRISGVGYGATSSYEGYTPGQKRLMAMRAAKLDAYRALVEQIYGIRVTSNSTVSSMMAQNDSFRVYVDSYLRGARVVSVTPMAEGNYETVLEIDIKPDFYSAYAK